MPAAATTPLVAGPRRVVDGFGQAVFSSSLWSEPANADEARAVLARAAAEGIPVAFRGAGRSYGDASINDRRVVLSTARMNRILDWDADAGVIDVEPGVTIEDLWRHALPRGFWPAVVPGTMFPTIGGCVAMNIHGKNHFCTGPFGDHVLELDLLTPAGESLRCAPDENPDLLRAVIGGFGMLGLATRVRLKLKPITSGMVRVEGFVTPGLDGLFRAFEDRLGRADYLVAWVDGTARGKRLGRAVVHHADYAPAADVPDAARTLTLAAQDLPDRFFGVIPRGQMWRLFRPWANSIGIRILNLVKYTSSRLFERAGDTHLQSLVAFSFLLDYVPRWRDAYGRGGFIQVQPFVPADAAPDAFRRILELCHARKLPPYLAVFKKHRPDDFLLSHALDGFSLALDFPVHARRRADLWRLGQDIADIVVAAGGRIYFAKDAVARADQVAAAFGEERMARFAELKHRVDPTGVLSSDLSRRVAPGLPVIDA